MDNDLQKKLGKLYLIPSSIEQNGIKDFLIESQKKEIQHLTHFIVENEKAARITLKALNLNNPIQTAKLVQHNKKHTLEKIDEYFEPIIAGKDIGLLSDSGNPCIADPGSKIVQRAHELKLKIKPLVGPSSILLGLIASGFNGQKFKFHGYIPIKKNDRYKFLELIQSNVIKETETQIFIETPYRNNQLLFDLLKKLNRNIRLCIAINLTSDNENIISARINDWRKKELPDLSKQLCVFLIN